MLVIIINIYKYGKVAQLRETPKALTTTYVLETKYNTHGNDVENSKNVKDIYYGQSASNF